MIDTPFAPRISIEQRLDGARLPPLARMAWLEIDLDALRGNLAALRAAVGPGVRVEPVVKADAYGHGAVPVARALEAAGVDGMSVATMDEAIELRDAGITSPLLVLYPVPAAWLGEAAARSIAVALGTGDGASAALAAVRVAASARRPPLEVHVEVETGLGRGGVLPRDAEAAVRAVLDTPGARLAGVWTHLAAADDNVLTVEQDRRFSAALATFANAVAWGGAPGNGGPPPHVRQRRRPRRRGAPLGRGANGHLTVRPRARCARPAGVDRCGGRGAPTRDGGVRATGARRGAARGPRRLVRADVRHDAPDPDRDPALRLRGRLATVPVRPSQSRWCAGVRVPLVGRVAMDAVMADVTDVPGGPVTERDEFVLLGVAGR